MFTSLPSLTQRIERLIDETPIVDPHTHIRLDAPTAPDLASLMSYHWVQTELKAVGLPDEDTDTRLPADERVRRALPYLTRMRNTAMSWCFYKILRDLYEFDEPMLTEGNYRRLLDRVEASAGDAEWAHRVLSDRCHVKTIVTSLGNRGANKAPFVDNAYFMLDAHYLFCPGVATDLQPFFDGRTTKAPYYEAVRGVLQASPSTAAALDRAVRDWLEATVTGSVRFSNTFIPIEQRFGPPDDQRVDSALVRAGRGEPLSNPEIDALVRAITWSVLGWHHDRRKAFQIAVGAEYFICGGKSIPRFQETWVTDMARTFHAFPNARFDLMMASDVHTHEVAVLCRQFPNVYASGYWWHNFFPATIERTANLRLQVAPMTKFGAFLCDAYYVEWTYGKLQVVRKALGAAVARLVESGFFEEDDVPSILHQILHDTPRDLYDLA